MTRDDTDFGTWLAARWPTLVRTLVFLGCPRADADPLAREVLVDCYADWERVRRAEDVEVHVHRMLLDRWRAIRRRANAAAPMPPALDSSDGERLRHALLAQLDELPADEREAAVLSLVADLSELQVADVLDVPPGTAIARTRRALAALDLVALRAAVGGEPGVGAGRR